MRWKSKDISSRFELCGMREKFEKGTRVTIELCGMREKLVQDLNCVGWERNLGRETRSNYSNYVGWERNLGQRGTKNKDRVNIITVTFRVREKIKEISSRFELCEIRERNLGRSKEISSRFELCVIREKSGECGQK